MKLLDYRIIIALALLLLMKITILSPRAGFVLLGLIPVLSLIAFLFRMALRSHHDRVTTGEAGMIGMTGRADTEIVPVDRMQRVSLRTVTMDVPPQDVITRDNVTVSVNAVVYFRVMEPRLAVVEVENYLYATSQLAQTTLRSVLGEVELDELLSARDKLNARLQEILDNHTDQWGIKVSLVEIKAVDLPQEMRRAMSRQAEAEREKRAKIIHAEGEYQAAEKLVAAASAIATEPVAIQLRYLQTLTEIGVEQNTTVVFPIPVQMLEALIGTKDREKAEIPISLRREPVAVSRDEAQ